MPLGVIQCSGLIRMLVFAGLVCAAGVSAAFAADVDDPLQSSEDSGSPTVEDLDRQLEDLKRRLDAIQSAPGPAPKMQSPEAIAPPKLRELKRRMNVLESLALGTSHTRGLVERGPGWSSKSGFFLQSNDGNFFLSLRGYVQADYTAHPAHPGKQTGLEPGSFPDTFNARRMRIFNSGRIFRQIRFEIAGDFAPHNNNLYNAFVEWDYFNWARLRVGEFKPGVNIEMTQSAVDLHFIERSLVQNLAPRRDYGVQLSGRFFRHMFRYELGAFNGSPVGPNNNPQLSFSGDKTLAARLMLTPFATSGPAAFRELDFGFAFTNGIIRNQTGQQGMLTQAQDRIVFQYKANVTGDGVQSLFLPFMRWYWGRFGMMSVFARRIEREKNLSTGASAALHFEAWEAQASFLLTDDQASFSWVDPKKPFKFSKPGYWGAIELAARYSELRVDSTAFALDMADITNNPAKTKALSVGLNWYLDHNVKMQMHWEHNDFDGAGPRYTAAGTLDSLIYRVTLVF
jgi:phosphate-selective porin OprO and OprP